MNNNFILDGFCWSFSRIETFDRCPLCFYLHYIKCLKGTEGVYGQYGSLIHDILERFSKGKLSEFDLSREYKNNFDRIITDSFPYNQYVDLREKYYLQGLEYFDTFEGFGDKKILGIENEYFFKVGDFDFTGKIDLECDNQIIDHKTKNDKGVITRLTKRHNIENYLKTIDGRFVPFDFFIQLYTYCIPYYQKYNKYPELLSLNMVRMHDWLTIEFRIEDFNKSIKWLKDKINEIYKTVEFLKGNDVGSYWCDNSCGQRIHCEHSNKYVGN